MQLKYVNYNRKSTDSEDRQILSIVAQEESAVEIAQKNGITISEVISESKSAKTPGRRIGFARMLSNIKRGRYNAIVCWKLDRIARNMEEGGQIIELLQQKKLLEIRTPGKVYTCNENIILLAVEFGSANQYSRDLSENVKRGLKKKAQLGFPHGIAPFGYINVRDERGNKHWKIDPERFNIINAVFNKALEGGMSTRELYKWTVHRFRPTTLQRNRVGGRTLTESRFYYILRNPIYAGFFEHDNVRYELEKSIPTVISEAQYWKLQKILNTTVASKKYRHKSTYTGLIKSPYDEYIGADVKYQIICDCKHKFSSVNRSHCPACNIPIHKMKYSKHLTYTYYYNVARKKRHEPIKMLSESIVDKEIWDMLSWLDLSPEIKDWIRRNAKRGNNVDELHLARLRQEKTITGLNAKRKKLRDLLVSEVITHEEYFSDMKEIDSAIGEIAQTLEEKDESFIKSLEVVLDAYEALALNDIEAKRNILLKIGSNLIWNEEKLDVIWPEWIKKLIIGINEARAENPEFEPKNSLANKDETGVFETVSPALCRTMKDVRESFYNDT